MLGIKNSKLTFKNIFLALSMMTITLMPLWAKIGKPTKPSDYIILSSFKSNKKIWGTYNQVFEAGYKINKKGERIKKNKAKIPLANIIFKDGKLFLIRPANKDNSYEFQVLDMPYKRIRKSTYAIDPSNHKDQLYSIFENHLNSMIKKGFFKKENINEISIDSLDFNQIICSKQRRIFHCEFSINFADRI